MSYAVKLKSPGPNFLIQLKSTTFLDKLRSEMTFFLRIQDPQSSAATLLELLLESTASASQGAAVFSFASTKGAQLLIGDPDFQRFLSRSEFELIVGIDAVTVPATLNYLLEAERRYERFKVSTFFHQKPGTLFHPKFCWFSSDDSMRVLVGSGNLTRGGLLKNWEAIADSTLDDYERNDLLVNWRCWKELNNHQLSTANDPGVLERAHANEREAHRLHEEDVVEEADSMIASDPDDALVLLAEIPRASDRWGQANFSLEVFENFFQLQPDRYNRVLLFPVNSDGTVGDPEVRQSVSVDSRNFRVELGLASGLQYPNDNRPIGAFLRTGTRRFRYRLLMPTEFEYDAVSAFINNRCEEPREERMKRIIISRNELNRALPNLTL